MFIFHTLISIFFYSLGVVSLVIFGGLFLFITFLPDAILFPYVKFMCRILCLSMGVWIRIEGKFPEGGPFIIMYNHGSFIDPFAYATIIRGRFTGVIAAEEFKIPLFGAMITRFKAIPVHRKRHKKALESIRSAERVIKEDGYHVAILPEGTRTLDGKMLPFKKGGFHMAINTNTSILPVGADLTYNYKPKNKWMLRPSIITIRIGTPTNVDDYEQLGVLGLLSVVENQIHELAYRDVGEGS